MQVSSRKKLARKVKDDGTAGQINMVIPSRLRYNLGNLWPFNRNSHAQDQDSTDIDSELELNLSGSMRGHKRAGKVASRTHPLRKACTLLVIVAMATFMYLLLANSRSHYFSIFKVTQNVYVNKEDNYHTVVDDYYSIVFDAGSTGTRVHVFHFTKKADGNLALVQELFRHIEPGLSFYADNPTKAVDSVNGLLKIAKDYVPENKWSTTPIILKATAGLRLLPGGKAQVLLEEVRKLFMSSLFQKLGDDFVSIMNGESEGIYGWLTVNFLSGKMEDDSDIHNMYGALDLGGGSVQITFPLPGEERILTDIPPSYIKSTEVASKKYTLYTHSYLGLGLKSARAGVLNATAFERSLSGTRRIKVNSPCFPDGYSKLWEFSGIKYEIRGSDQCSFENCLEVMKKIISRKKVDQPASVKELDLFAFSYFFDRAVDLGRIDSSTGGELQVGDFIESAQTVCQRGNVSEKPFLCLDTTVISSLLTDGLGLGFHQTLKLKKKIGDTEISWALGAALHLYEKTRTSQTS